MATLPLENLITAAVNSATELDEDRKRSLNIIKDSTSLVTKSPWLRRTRWEEMFTGKDMKALNQLALSPGQRDTRELYIWSSVERILRECFSAVLDCHTRGWDLVLFWLASVDKNKEDTKPFRTHMDPKAMKRYIGHWQGYIMFCFRAVTTDPNVEFTQRQTECLYELLSMVELDNVTDKSIIDGKVRQLSTLLIQHSDYTAERSSLIYYCGVLGFNVEFKQWRQPQDYTNILAGIQWCVRVVMLEYSLPCIRRDELTQTPDANPVEIFRAIRDKWLVDGEATPFGYIHRLLNYGIAASRNATTRSRIRWAADDKTLYFDGRALKLSTWIEFVNQTLSDAEKLLSRQLFMTDGDLPEISLDVVDDPSNHDAGHYWILDEVDAWPRARTGMITRLQLSDRWEDLVKVDGDGLVWLASGVDEYNADDIKLRELMAVLMMVVCGLSGRGTELTSLRYINTIDGDRGIYVEDGQIMFITEYHKSMALTDEAKVQSQCAH